MTRRTREGKGEDKPPAGGHEASQPSSDARPDDGAPSPDDPGEDPGTDAGGGAGRGKGQPPQLGPGRWMFWLMLAVMLGLFLWQRTLKPSSSDAPSAQITYSAFYRLLDQDRIERVTLSGRRVSGDLTQPTVVGDKEIRSFRTQLPDQDDPTLMPKLHEKGVEISAISNEGDLWPQLLGAILPWVLLIGVWVWISRRAQKSMTGGGGPFAGVLKGTAKRFAREVGVPTRFEDVAGHASAKRDLREIVEFLRKPARYRRLGAKAPRGTLLMGPPGTGKTLLARAVAGEAGVAFFSISGSEFIELFVGVGASRVRELFQQAKKEAPAIIFIDEIDAVGRSRGTGLGGGNDEREQTLNQLLSEMDGFTRSDDIVVLAATNRPDVLDPALLRPGRFDRRVVLGLPERAARKAMLEVHTKGKPLSPDVDLDALAGDTPGLSGAELANLVNEAILNATRRDADSVEPEDFAAAYEKVTLGDPREARLTPEEKKRVAMHEAGHAIVARFTPHAPPLRRVTIIPRGMSLGATMQMPEEDRHIATKDELIARLRVLMGGYAAEKSLTGTVSTGAENDLQRATDLASDMVAHYGMSDVVGPMYHAHKAEHPFLGQKLATDGGISEETVHLIEVEARRLLVEAESAAEKAIDANRAAYDRLVAALCEHETLEEHALHDVIEEAPPESTRRANSG